MRDLLLMGVVLGALGATIRYPYVGVMVWVWFSLQNPHQEAYGFAHTLSLVFIIAIVTTTFWLISKERKAPPKGMTVPLILLLLAWTTVNTFVGFDPGYSWPFWGRMWKTIAMCVVAATMATTRVRLHAMIWVVALSLAYYGVKGGIFTFVTGGHNHVFGPEDSMIRDNNELADALVMTLPILNYLRLHSGARWIRWGITVSIILCVASILGSYSREAYVALFVLAVVFWLRAKNRLVYPIAAAIVLVPLLKFMPDSFYQRLASIQNFSTDSSFQTRVDSWWLAYRYAMDHIPFGAGFYAMNLQQLWAAYGLPNEMHAVHSIYFQTLGEQGVIGLALYLMVLGAAFLNLHAAIRQTKGIPDLRWANDLARMLQLSLVSFCVAGAAAPMNFYDGFFLLVVMTATLREQTKPREATMTALVPSQPVLISGAPR